MTYQSTLPNRHLATNAVHMALLAFPIACFSLALLSDIAYWRTLNLLWLHFSEWLLLAGLVFGGADLLVRLAEVVVRAVRPSWFVISGGVAVLLLAALNSFIHAADGWTAVMPWGLTVSALTVLVMLVTGWFGHREVRHA